MKIDLEKWKKARFAEADQRHVDLLIKALEEAKKIIEIELTKVTGGADYTYSDKNVWLNKYFGSSDE